MRHNLSVIIICKNEASRIRSCLESVKWADEIVVVDSGSSDNTLEIVQEYTDRISINADWPGFGPQKKLAEDLASFDWVLSIDSDEVISEELRDEIQSVLINANDTTVYRLNRLTHFCGKFIHHSGWYPDRITRLYNKKNYHFNSAAVHESVECRGAKKIDLKGNLLHYTFQTLDVYIDKRNSYAKVWAKSQFEKKRSVSIAELLTRTLFSFVRHYLLKKGFLDGYQGLLISVIQMQYTFNKYNYLLFMQREER